MSHPRRTRRCLVCVLIVVGHVRCSRLTAAQGRRKVMHRFVVRFDDLDGTDCSPLGTNSRHFRQRVDRPTIFYERGRQQLLGGVFNCGEQEIVLQARRHNIESMGGYPYGTGGPVSFKHLIRHSSSRINEDRFAPGKIVWEASLISRYFRDSYFRDAVGHLLAEVTGDRCRSSVGRSRGVEVSGFEVG